MNSFFHNKILISILIISALFYFASVRNVYAGRVWQAITLPLTIPLRIINVIINIPLSIAEIAIGSIPGIGRLPGFGFLVDDGTCRFSRLSGSPFEIYAGRCGPGALTLISATPGCVSSYQPTFYIPQFSSTGFQIPIPGSAYVCGYTDNYNPDTGTNDPIYCYNYTTINKDTDKQIAIYRFSIPASSDQTTLNNWYFNTIKNNVGNGFTDLGSVYPGWGTIQCYPSSYHVAAGDVTPLGIFSYSQVCTGNVCTIIDNTVPENSYVVYVAKMLGNYAGFRYIQSTSEGSLDECPNDVNNLNKFLNKDNNNMAVADFPSVGDLGASLGTAIVGPLKTGPCPPTVDIKANGSDGPVPISYNAAANLTWTSSSNATACTVSPPGWTGTSGAQSTGNLTSSVIYTANCTGPGGSASDSVTVNVGGAAPTTTPKYKCSGASCVQDDVNGTYTVSNCDNACTPPPPPPPPPPPTTPDFYPLSSNNIYVTMPKGVSGDSTETAITIVSANGFSSNISFSVVSADPALPSASTYLFSRPNLSSSLYSSGSTFKVHIGSGLQTSQTFSIVIKAIGAGLTRTTTILLNANIKNPSFIEF